MQVAAKVDSLGRLTQLKTQDGECVVGEPLNQLALYNDHPKYWEAWDLDADAMDRPRYVDTPARVEQVVFGAGRPAVRVTRELGKQSRITQTISITPGSPRVDVDTEVDWREERTLLRVLFPTNIIADEATCEIPFGHVRRSTRRETPEEGARFEVPAHRWMDLSQKGRGLAVLNDCKYGHSCHGGVMGLSLLRSCKWPDEQADMGLHRFRYSLIPHGGDWREVGVDQEAELMVRPMWAVPLEMQQSGPTSEWEPRELALFKVTCSGGSAVRVAAVKRAEDRSGVIVRVVESHGLGGECLIRWSLPAGHVEMVDLLERSTSGSALTHEGGVSRFALGPFQIVSLLVRS
jgi:alpha-mannosidase